jgi:hypothetical protein
MAQRYGSLRIYTYLCAIPAALLYTLMGDILQILFNIIPLALFLYLSLSLMGLIKLNQHTAFLANASFITRFAVYGGTIAFAIMTLVDLTK